MKNFRRPNKVYYGKCGSGELKKCPEFTWTVYLRNAEES